MLSLVRQRMCVQHRQSFPCLLHFLLPHSSFFFPLPLSLHPHSPSLSNRLCTLCFPSLRSFFSSLSEQVWPRETGRQRHWCVTVPMATTSYPLSLSLSHQLISLKHMRVGKHTRTHGYSDLHAHTHLLCHPVPGSSMACLFHTPL